MPALPPVALLTLALLGGACAPAHAEEALPEWARDAPEEGARLRLVRPGAAPHAPLRFEAPVGAAGAVEVTLSLTMAMTFDGVPLPAEDLPAQTVALDLAVTAATPDSWTWTATVRSVAVAGAAAPAPPAAGPMDALAGSQITLTADRTGRVTQTQATPPAGLPPELVGHLARIEEAAGLLVPPLPPEPVGVGAVWEVVRRVAPGGFAAVEQQVWLLVERDGGRLVLDRTSSQVVRDEAARMSGLPPGAQATVTAFSSDGLGRWTQDLGAVGPAQAAWANDLTATVSVSTPDQGAHDLGVQMSARLTVTPRLAPAQAPGR